MRIGLIGAPGSGKTDFAEALGEALEEQGQSVFICDDYVDTVEMEFDYVMGRMATYVGNLAIALERHKCERQQEDRYDVLIACGTIIDTATYMAAENTLVSGDEHWARRYSSTLAVMGCLVDDMFTYDHTFYLPSTPEDTFEKAVAEGLPTALDVFDIPHIKLDHILTEDRVAHALTHLAREATTTD